MELEQYLEGVKIKRELTTKHDSHRKPFGKGSRQCRSCYSHTAFIRKYDLNICRRCFREYANDIGFKQLD